jgi:hypothetical protein
MRISEPDPLFCKPVNVWRFDPGFRIQTTQIAISQIIGQDIDDIGPWW